MYDYNITIQETNDFFADMAEMAAFENLPTEDEMDAMAEYFGEK